MGKSVSGSGAGSAGLNSGMDRRVKSSASYTWTRVPLTCRIHTALEGGIGRGAGGWGGAQGRERFGVLSTVP